MTTSDAHRSPVSGVPDRVELTLAVLRDVGRLITTCRSSHELLAALCTLLGSRGDFVAAWAAELDLGGSTISVHAIGLDPILSGARGEFPGGELPTCARAALSTSDVVEVDPSLACRSCPLSSTPCGAGRSMTVRMATDDICFGVITVALDLSRTVDGDDRALLTDAAGLATVSLRGIAEAERRRQAEFELFKSAERLDRVFRTIEDVFYETSLDGTILEISPSIEFVSKYTREELLGTSALDLYTDPTQRDSFLNEVTQRGQLRDYQVSLKDKDGSARSVSLSVAVMLDQSGAPERLIGSMRDISDRVRAEEALRASEEKFSKAFYGAPVTVAISSLSEGRYTEVNDTFLTTLGHSRQAVIGATSLELGVLSDEDRSYLVQRIREHGHVRNLELRLFCADGTPLDCLYSGELLDIDGEPHLLSIAVDISDRKRALDALQRRLHALTRPLDAEEGISFEDLFQIDDLQRIQDEFADATGVASIITEPDGTPITKPSRFCRLCSELIRTTEQGLSNCHRSDAILGSQNPGGPTVRPCMSGGLWDAGASISVGGRHVANWLIGQVRNEAQSEDHIIAYAREIGADPEDMVAAFREVPSMSREKFEKVAQVLFSLAQQLSQSAYQTVQQARFIESQQRVVDALQESERDLSRAQALARIGSWRFDLTAGTVIASAETRRIYGLEADLMAIPVVQQVPLPEHRAELDRALQALITENEPYDVEFRIARPSDGAIRDIRSIAEYDRDKNRVTGAIQDITESKRLQEEIRRSEQTYRTLLQGLPDIVMRFDRNGRFIFISDNVRDVVGFSPDEVIGSTTRELGLPMDLCEFWDEHIFSVFRHREPLETEFSFPHASGTLHFNWRVLPELAVNGTVESVLSIARDITETKLMTDRMRHMEKMDAIGQLAGGVAHDFNNQLTAIMGYGEILQDELHDPSLQRYVGYMLTGARRSAELTNQLLAFSRKSDQQSAPIDMHSIVHEVVGILSRSIDRRIHLRQHLDATQYTVMGDASQIQNAILNLGVNARDAMPNGGEILFATRTVQLSELDCAQLPQDIPPGRYIELRVHDTGQGMSAEVQRRIFEPFFTTKEVGKGTGMGLAAVYGTIRQHRGTISCESEEGKGTCFTFHLPLASGPTTGAEDPVSVSATFPGKRVLLVDDEDVLRSLATDLLHGMGCTVHAAADGLEGVEYYRQHWRDIDIVILDLIMPRVDGRETFLCIRELNPHAKVLIASGFSARGGARELLENGAAGFLKKPFSRRELVEKLAGILEGSDA